MRSGRRSFAPCGPSGESTCHLPESKTVTGSPSTCFVLLIHNSHESRDRNRSPDHLLKEIILVDDFSQRQELKHTLEVYSKYYFGDRVRILRTSKREGLIRARIMGAKQAKGDVLIFLVSCFPPFPFC